MSVSRTAPLSCCTCGFAGRYPVPSSTAKQDLGFGTRDRHTTATLLFRSGSTCPTGVKQLGSLQYVGWRLLPRRKCVAATSHTQPFGVGVFAIRLCCRGILLRLPPCTG